MQESPKNHKKIYYRLRRSDPHERLGATLRHFSFGAAVFFVSIFALTYAAHRMTARYAESRRKKLEQELENGGESED